MHLDVETIDARPEFDIFQPEFKQLLIQHHMAE